MQTVNCLLALAGDHGNVVPKYGVTAAEVAVLRILHGDEAVFDIEIADDIDRRNRDELLRLREKYARRQPNGEVVAPEVNMLFPGVAARVFDTIDELDLPDEMFKAARRAPAPAAAPKEETSSVDDLEHMKLAQLLEFAAVRQIDLGGVTKKSAVLAAINGWLEARRPAPTEDDEEDDGIDDMADGAAILE